MLFEEIVQGDTRCGYAEEKAKKRLSEGTLEIPVIYPLRYFSVESMNASLILPNQQHQIFKQYKSQCLQFPIAHFIL